MDLSSLYDNSLAYQRIPRGILLKLMRISYHFRNPDQ